MKLRNKKTGEIKYLQEVIHQEYQDHNIVSLNKLYDEWEDYEEPKGYWYINEFGTPTEITHTRENIYDKQRKNFGNYFESEEEAVAAVEKLKAYKRLKDNGFKFQFWTSSYSGDNIAFFIDWINADSKKETEEDLDLLFGGEE